MRTDPNSRKHVPRDGNSSEKREGIRHARRVAKVEARQVRDESDPSGWRHWDRLNG